jgi:hypothetical protein
MYLKIGSYGSIVAGSDNITLIDPNGLVIDGISWATSLTGGSLLQRQADAIFTDKLIETDAPDDFEKINTLIVPDNGLEEWVIADVCSNIDGFQLIVPDGNSIYENGICLPSQVDICPNIDGMQTVIQPGFELDEMGDCVPDVCINILGLQTAIPAGKELDANGDCIDHDECSNLIGVQSNIPDGFIKSEDNNCKLNLLPLRLSELLPNAISSDIDSEFIEIYNPNDVDVDLANYVIYVGMGFGSHYKFPVDSHVGSGQYMVFSNNDIKFTLVNTESSVRLSTIDDIIIDETLAYDSPKEGMSWALIDEVWQYTNRPTPGSVNLLSLIEPEPMPVTDVVRIVAVSDLKPCAANQYRSLETNRCRLIVASDAVLAPCKDGEYRSEETNRCRSISAAVLGDSDLVPCDEGQERNPETNRCRNIVSAMPKADYAPEPTSQATDNNILWWSLGGVGFVAIVYGFWEWRIEIGRLIHKIRLLLQHNK